MTIRIDQVVTRGGDLGLTSLGDGTRVAKDCARVEAYGAVDEANATLGVLRATLQAGSGPESFLTRVQNMLFDVGADLCVPEKNGAAPRLDDASVRAVEEEIAVLLARQAPLDSFVLPAGSTAASQAHVARTVMRRAERRVVALAAAEPVTPAVIRLLNRLSDYLFVLSRHLNDDGRADVLWEPGGAQRSSAPASGAPASGAPASSAPASSD
jgi:cob(I)alamin adenosyltransferase